MPSEDAAVVEEVIAQTVRLHELAKSASAGPTVSAAAAMTAALRRGGKVLVFGNGGSASDAQHFAAELVGRFVRERRAIPAVALTTDTSILTAIGNDYGFDRVFGRQVEALGRAADIHVNVPSPDTARVQEVHRTLLHAICELVERDVSA
jgi:D-sedoheptulose 7-phosphate isomerase